MGHATGVAGLRHVAGAYLGLLVLAAQKASCQEMFGHAAVGQGMETANRLGMGQLTEADMLARSLGLGQPNTQAGQLNGHPGQMNGQAGQLNGQAEQLNGQAGQLEGQAGQVNGQAGQPSVFAQQVVTRLPSQIQPQIFPSQDAQAILGSGASSFLPNSLSQMTTQGMPGLSKDQSNLVNGDQSHGVLSQGAEGLTGDMSQSSQGIQTGQMLGLNSLLSQIAREDDPGPLGHQDQAASSQAASSQAASSQAASSEVVQQQPWHAADPSSQVVTILSAQASPSSGTSWQTARESLEAAADGGDVAKSSADVASSISTKYSISPICWTSIPLRDLPQGQDAEGIPGVAVLGQGCSRCVVGAACSFTITVQEPASWLPAGLGNWRELNVILAGPALHAGLVQPLASDDSTFLVTYRIWDAGTYRVSIRSSCGNLKSSPDQNQQMDPHEMASWEMEVRHVASRKAATWLQGQGTSLSNLAAYPSSPSDVALLTCPCSQRTYGRWKAEGRAYRWTPFKCAGMPSLEPSNWALALNQHGIHEINFIGDSHQRMLMLHLRYLASAEFDKKHGKAHTDFNYTMQLGTARLQLNFYWVTGVTQAASAFGCKDAAKAPKELALPKASSTADVWIVGMGSWTGGYCDMPELAFAAEMPHFLLQLSNLVMNAWGEKQQQQQQGSKKPLFLYRSTPPRATEELKCQNQLTNQYVNAVNRVGKLLARQVDALYLDLWEVEAPRFKEVCPRDRHYSCPMQDRQRGVMGMGGSVGEGDVHALIYFLLNN